MPIPRLDELLQVLNGAFAAKAEAYSPSVVGRVFSDMPWVMPDLLQRQHTAIFGRKGTGKSMLLRYLSVPVQVRVLAMDHAQKLPWFGIYIVLSKGSLPQAHEDAASNPDYGTLFDHWFNCRIADALIGSLSDILRYLPKCLCADERSIAEGMKVAIGPGYLADGASLKDFRRSVRELTHRVREFVAAHETAGEVSVENFRRVTGFRGSLYGPRRFLETITDVLRECLVPEVAETRFVLLDQWDSLSPLQQTRLSSLFVLEYPASWYMKVGSVREPSGQLPPLPADELAVRRIEVDPDGPGFRRLCRSALEARLSYVRATLAEKAFSPGLVTAFSDADSLLPSASIEAQFETWREHQHRLFPPAVDATEITAFSEFHAAGVQPLYSGLDAMTSIASGFLRIFLELVYRVLTFAFSSEERAEFAGSIPVDLQDSAIRKECQELLDQKLRADAASLDFDLDAPGDLARTWIRSLLKRFGQGLNSTMGDYYLHRITVVLPEEEDGEDERPEALRDLLAVCGLTTSVATTETPTLAEYKITRAFSPLENLPLLTSQRGLRLSHQQFLDLGGKRGWRKIQPDEQKSLVPTRTFLATVFRPDSWQEAVRETLRLHIFEALHLEYHDGEPYHHAAMEIGAKIRAKMREMNLFLFEITDENPNVCFEWGMALALHQPCYFLLNTAITGSKQRQKDSRVFRLQYSGYDWPSNQTATASTGDVFESLYAAIAALVHDYGNRPPGPRNPLGTAKPLDFTQVPKSIYVYSETSGRVSTWSEEIEQVIRSANCTPIRPPVVGRTTTLEKHLEAASRGEKCLVDVSDCDSLGCTLLGYLFMKDREVLAVYDKAKPGVFTNWIAADAFAPYETKSDFLRIMGRFLKE